LVGHLLHRAEAYARESGAVEMRVGVLSRNVAARGLYKHVGFEPHLETLVKRLT
jgi:ribosomal protein S18 acetylase RimI-like enzyme